MKIGLVGLPKSGKTSLFNLLTGASVATSSYGGSRAEMHAGVARVPDERVDRLSALFKPKKTTFASFEVVDLAGITKGEREGLDAKEFRNADALLHVVRAFSDAAGTAPNPKGDIADLETELILADLEVVERRLERLEASIKKKRTDADVKEQAILLRLKPALESETPIRAADLSDDDARAIRGFTFLSQKPILHCLNLSLRARGDRRAPGHGRGLGLGRHRGRSGAAGGGGAGGLPGRPRAQRAGYQARASRLLFAPGADLVLHGWRGRGARLVCSARHPRPGRRGGHPLGHRARLHPRRGRRL
jgi:hypothetical protein